MIQFQCPKCGKRLVVKDESAGKRAKCPGCGQVMVVGGACVPAEAGPDAGLAEAPMPAKAPSGQETDPQIVELLTGLGEYENPYAEGIPDEATMARLEPVMDELAGNLGAPPTLLALVKDESTPENLRHWAAWGVRCLGGEARASLMQLAEDPSLPADLRHDVLEGLVQEDAKAGQRVIRRSLEDPAQQALHEDARRILAEGKADRASTAAVALIGLLVSLVLVFGGLLLNAWIPFCFTLIPIALGVSGIGVSINMLRGKA